MNSYKRTALSFGLSICICTPVSLYAQSTTHSAALAPMEKAMVSDRNNFFFIDPAHYPGGDASLPVGVFDSGTGGLTILNTLLNYDEHHNSTGKQGKDAVADFAKEKFIYLADQANMPYGNYYSEKKSDLLIEHVLKDVQFLMSDKYYAGAENKQYSTDKKRVKTIVIACNTATAYAKSHLEDFIRRTGINLKIIGVIDAGARGALEQIGKNENASIAVFATVGTVASGGYERTILAFKDKLGYTGKLNILSQGGYGLAEAVDEEPDFINRKASSPAANYRGPSLQSAEYKIDKTLLDLYNFNFDHNQMLCDTKNSDDCQVMQLNSTGNYVRYHLVSLMEKMRKSPGAPPLKALILGCTHYPYLVKEIRQTLQELYHYKKNGKYIYRPFMVADVKLIDPAVNVAAELYDHLAQQKLLNSEGNQAESEFYISVPNNDNPQTRTDAQGRFTYAYKYGRKAGEIQEYVKMVPFSESNIPAETFARFRELIPSTHALIQAYRNKQEKWKNALQVVDGIYKDFARKNDYPGLVYGIVRNGQLIYTGNTGLSNIEKQIPATSTSAFRIASMTKSFVSVAILQLRDQGKLKLDDPAYNYIPELKQQHYASDDAPLLTVRHLLTHAAGFPEDNPWGDRQLAISNEAMLAMVKKGISFSNSPGVKYEYSNLGFALLGYIIQQVSGLPYEEYIDKNILTPLNMAHTYWEYSKVPANELALGYRRLNNNWVEQPMLHSGAYGAMGGMITTIEDFAKYMNFHLSGWPARNGPEDGPLKRSSIREMQQPWNFNTLNARYQFPGETSACPMVAAYGYGLRWTRDCKGRVMVGHSGGLPGFGTNWTILPDYGIGVVCFANLTYASATYINTVVIDTLLDLTGATPRPIPVTPILDQRKKELVAFLPDWQNATNSDAFADNFFLDYFPDSLRKEAKDIFTKAGAIKSIGTMVPENNLRGYFLIEGEKATIEVRFTLTPETPAKIQEYEIRRL
ncbi:serine hydrolase [Pseudobacter ginsenosidimutans]|nr:serine hydrolase [Pseudobacter ginsenosidimutans]